MLGAFAAGIGDLLETASVEATVGAAGSAARAATVAGALSPGELTRFAPTIFSGAVEETVVTPTMRSGGGAITIEKR
jgi:hypothetical protein